MTVLDSMKLLAHDYNSVNELSTEELKMLISEILDIDEVPFALNELYGRDARLAIQLGKNILNKNLGDEYLQAAIIDFFAERDKQYLVEYINGHLETIDTYVYNEVLNWLTEVSEEPFSRQFSEMFLKEIVDKYKLYNEKQKSKIEHKYRLFLKAYQERL